MTRVEKIIMHLSLAMAVAAMITGHVLIMMQGLWFIPGKEKYNLHTRWVSDFAEVVPEGWWIKGSIILFCFAWIIFMRPQFRIAGDHLGGHIRWAWNLLLTVGVVGGLLLVAFYDMSPPQFTQKDPSWLGKLLGEKPRRVEVSRTPREYIEMWHHRLGFQLFLISFSLALATACSDKIRSGCTIRARRDFATLVFVALLMFWLFTQHQTLAGIPQRCLLILIFWWVWQENWNRRIHQKTGDGRKGNPPSPT